MSSGASASPRMGDQAPPPREPAEARALPAEHVRSHPARFRGGAARRRAALPHAARRLRAGRDHVTAEVEDLERGATLRDHGAVPRRLRRRPQPGARDARHRHERQPRAHLHHQRHLPLPDLVAAARQGAGLSVHHPRARGHVGHHRGDQRPRPVALLAHRQPRAARAHAKTRSMRRSGARSASISTTRSSASCPGCGASWWPTATASGAASSWATPPT